jgi:hypothetical protein
MRRGTGRAGHRVRRHRLQRHVTVTFYDDPGSGHITPSVRGPRHVEAWYLVPAVEIGVGAELPGCSANAG